MYIAAGITQGHDFSFSSLTEYIHTRGSPWCFQELNLRLGQHYCSLLFWGFQLLCLSSQRIPFLCCADSHCGNTPIVWIILTKPSHALVRACSHTHTHLIIYVMNLTNADILWSPILANTKIQVEQSYWHHLGATTWDVSLRLSLSPLSAIGSVVLGALILMSREERWSSVKQVTKVIWHIAQLSWILLYSYGHMVSYWTPKHRL